MNVFENDYKFSEKFTNVLNEIYKEHFDMQKIRRSNTTDFKLKNIYSTLDRDLGIDATIVDSYKQRISIQEKVRRNIKYRDLTIEYKNGNGKNCEWNHRLSHIQVYCWTNNHEITEIIIIESFRLTRWINQQTKNDEFFIKDHLLRNQKHGSAQFLAIPIANLPKDLIYKHIIL